MDPGRPGALLPLVTALHEALALESKFQPHLELPPASADGTEITAGVRAGSAHVLRCLKVWYDLPSDVLFVAINLVDRFLTKMKVRPKHMACISVASFQLAASQVSSTMSGDGFQPPEPKDLAAISQCKCTLGDLARMESIISSKLSAEPNTLPVTALTFVRLLHAMMTVVAEHTGLREFYSRAVSYSSLCLQLEILACDAACANFRPSAMALVLICQHLASFPESAPLVSFAAEYQQLCNISSDAFLACHAAVVHILERYHAHAQLPYRQRLVWRLSQRTMRLLRPTDKLVSTLPTIDEHGQLQLPSGDEWGEVPPTTFHCHLA